MAIMEMNTESAFFRLALDSCPDLVFVKSEELRITYANKAMLELYAPEKRAIVIGSTTVEEFSPAEAEVFLAADYETLELGHTKRVESIVDYTGKTRVFSSTKTRFIDQWGRPSILGVSTDITHLVERGNRLRRTNDALEKYAASVAHDLASPLSTLSMIGEMIQSDPATHLSVPTRKRLQDGINIVGGLATQVKALLLICKAESAGNVDREVICLSELVDRVRTSLSATLEATGAVLTCVHPTDLRCHPALVEALLQNLIENSLKYRSKEAPQIRVTCQTTRGTEVLSVSDNGVGVKQGDARKIFATRTQLNPRASGAGLGLAMCQDIVDLHRGTIWVFDQRDRQPGTTICFTLDRSEPFPSVCLQPDVPQALVA